MSEPSYRIDVEHDPGNDDLPFDAHIYRLSDNVRVATRWGVTSALATQRALEWIAAQNADKQPSTTVYATETGERCNPPADLEASVPA